MLDDIHIAVLLNVPIDECCGARTVAIFLF